MEKPVYLYVVYENYKHYKKFNRFYAIALTANQVDIREQYIDKDKYEIEFFAIPPGYVDKVFKYIQDKYIRSNFPINVKAGELQVTCKEFINKCSQIMQEKSNSLPSDLVTYNQALPSVTPSLTLQHQVSNVSQYNAPLYSLNKLIVLLRNKLNDEVTVLCNDDTLSPTVLLSYLHQINKFQVLQNAVMPTHEINDIISSFQQDFNYYKTTSIDFQLQWYKITEQEVLLWLNKRNSLPIKSTEVLSPLPPLQFDTNQFLSISMETTTTSDINLQEQDKSSKKRKL